MNHLFYGDNLDVLHRHVEDESIDLVYLDPPFKSNQDYNVLFRERNGTKAASQILAFEDTWEWNDLTARTCEQIIEAGGKTSDAIRAFRTFLGRTDMMAYLAMMAPRLIELRRKLAPTGSIYLHCDPTSSHYLKMLMDAVFGAQNFRNEIVWQRTNSHNTANQYGRVHDIILFYAKTDQYRWNEVLTDYSDAQRKRYHQDGEGRWYTGQDLTAARPNSSSGKFEWRGTMPPPTRGWGYTLKQLEEWWEQGRILTKKDGTPRMDGLRVHLDEMPGKRLQSVWTDIHRIPNTSPERLGYPTQKPEALLERIVLSSSDKNDIVLDPFCGCGTAVEVAEKLNRQWIGIDITHLAIAIIKHRLQDRFGDSIRERYEVTGEPVSLPDARALAEENPFQFQCWAAGLVGARPTEPKRGADRGVDGRLFFHDDKTGDSKQIVLSVKSGERLAPAFVRDLRGVVQREGAQIGVLITMAKPTREMRKESASAGFYTSPWGRHPTLQILTVEELLNGATVDRPPTREVDATFRRRGKRVGRPPQQMRFPGAS